MIMGILNVTPDSFSDGGKFADPRAAIEHALLLAEQGADIIDIGGESTRPGSDAVSVQEELDRVLPVFQGLAGSGLVLSIDTMKPEVADAAVQAGARIINDVTGMVNPRMVELAVRHQVTVCAMHMQGAPKSMQASPQYQDVVKEVKSYLRNRVEALVAAGLPKEKIWIDPGIGFGKMLEHNLALLRALDQFVATGSPVLLGVSRKSFLGTVLGSPGAPLPVTEREEGTLAVHVMAQLAGVSVIRTHNVVGAVRARAVVSALSPGVPPG